MPGRNACPPEHVGGGPEYVDFLDTISDSSHNEHDHLLEWCGGNFDPNAFDLDVANQRLFEVKF